MSHIAVRCFWLLEARRNNSKPFVCCMLGNNWVVRIESKISDFEIVWIKKCETWKVVLPSKSPLCSHFKVFSLANSTEFVFQIVQMDYSNNPECKLYDESLDASDMAMIYAQDKEFNWYLRIARDLMKKMRLAEDRRVCEKYIRSCLSMSNSTQSVVKFHRNRFFRFLLKTMRRTVDQQDAKGSAFVHFVSFWYCTKLLWFNSSFTQPDGGQDEVKDGQEMTQWSADHRSYVAAKIIPGFGTLVSDLSNHESAIFISRMAN